jgi:hypothetical protein
MPIKYSKTEDMEYNPVSYNNRLIVEKYVKGELRDKVRNGLAFIDQKLSLKGLKVLVDAHISLGGYLLTIPKGSIAYIKEEDLHTKPWGQKPLESDAVEGPFLIIDLANVEFIAPPRKASDVQGS